MLYKCGLRRNMEGNAINMKEHEEHLEDNRKCYNYAGDMLELEQKIIKTLRNIRKEESKRNLLELTHCEDKTIMEMTILLFIQDSMEITESFNKNEKTPIQPQKVALKKGKQIKVKDSL